MLERPMNFGTRFLSFLDLLALPRSGIFDLYCKKKSEDEKPGQCRLSENGNGHMLQLDSSILRRTP